MKSIAQVLVVASTLLLTAPNLQVLTLTWGNASSYTYERTNEKIAINGDQATVTADIADSAIIQGQTLSSKMRETATVESVDGRLMITQVVAHQRL